MSRGRYLCVPPSYAKNNHPRIPIAQEGVDLDHNMMAVFYYVGLLLGIWVGTDTYSGLSGFVPDEVRPQTSFKYAS